MRKHTAVLLLVLISFPALADARATSPGDRFAKIIRIIKRIFVPAPQGDLSLPHP